MHLPQRFPSPSTHSGDGPIRSTDNDAAVARLSAAQKRYIVDPFVHLLVPRAQFIPARPPLINIGTYIRTTAIDALIDQWLQAASLSGQKCQIISLGAGSDTRFWRIAAGAHENDLKTYIEMDFPEITTKKAMAIRKHKELSQPVGPPDQISLAQGGTALRSAKYHLLPLDLRRPPEETLEPVLLSPSDNPLIDPSLPTLILFECVLAYMSPEASDRLLTWLANMGRDSATPGPIGCIVYEMFGLNDSFGKVMLNNLKTRQIEIPGVMPYPDEASLQQRFLKTGFTAARALSLKEIRRAYISNEELERISTLEFLDEVEELDLVLAHYAISWGLFLPSSESTSQWANWGLQQLR